MFGITAKTRSHFAISALFAVALSGAGTASAQQSGNEESFDAYLKDLQEQQQHLNMTGLDNRSGYSAGKADGNGGADKANESVASQSGAASSLDNYLKDLQLTQQHLNVTGQRNRSDYAGDASGQKDGSGKNDVSTSPGPVDAFDQYMQDMQAVQQHIYETGQNENPGYVAEEKRAENDIDKS